jgi:hypothetical protein
LKNIGSHPVVFFSADTLLDPRDSKVVEIRITSKTASFEMILIPLEL